MARKKAFVWNETWGLLRVDGEGHHSQTGHEWHVELIPILGFADGPRALVGSHSASASAD